MRRQFKHIAMAALVFEIGMVIGWHLGAAVWS